MVLLTNLLPKVTASGDLMGGSALAEQHHLDSYQPGPRPELATKPALVP